MRLKKEVREHAMVIHNDYTEKSAPKRFGELFPDEASNLINQQYSNYERVEINQ